MVHMCRDGLVWACDRIHPRPPIGRIENIGRCTFKTRREMVPKVIATYKDCFHFPFLDEFHEEVWRVTIPKLSWRALPRTVGCDTRDIIIEDDRVPDCDHLSLGHLLDRLSRNELCDFGKE